MQTPKLETHFAVRRSTTGRQLLHQVADILELKEHWFFGLQFVDNQGNTVWLSPEEGLTSRAAHNKNSPLQFSFSARFWPQEAAWTLGDVATELLFLQVRSAVLDGSITCLSSSAIELAAYALQARCGDFTDSRLERGQLTRNRHLPKKLEGQLRGASEEWQERVAVLHQRLRGLPRRDAMHEYLQRAQQLPGYGATFFNIRCGHPLGGQTTGRRDSWFWMGVTPSGITVSEDKLTPLLRIPWQQILSVRYHRCKFSIQVRDSDRFRFFTHSRKQSTEGVKSAELLETIKGQKNAVTQQRKNSDEDDISVADASSFSEDEAETLAECGSGCGCGQQDGSEEEEEEEEEDPVWREPLAATGWLERMEQWRRQGRMAGGGRSTESVDEPAPPPLRTAQSTDSGLASCWGSSADVVESGDARLTSADARLTSADARLTSADARLTSADAGQKGRPASRDSGLMVRLSVTSDEVFV